MKKELKFEDALKKLETIVDRLESGEAQLEESIELFEEGTKLIKICNEKLNEVKKKIEIIVKNDTAVSVETFKNTNRKKDGESDEQ